MRAPRREQQVRQFIDVCAAQRISKGGGADPLERVSQPHRIPQHVHRERIRQIQEQALEKMRVKIEERDYQSSALAV